MVFVTVELIVLDDKLDKVCKCSSVLAGSAPQSGGKPSEAKEYVWRFRIYSQICHLLAMWRLKKIFFFTAVSSTIKLQLRNCFGV